MLNPCCAEAPVNRSVLQSGNSVRPAVRRWSVLSSMLLVVALPALAEPAAVSPHWNAVQAGADRGGQSDCTAVLQKLLDAAGKDGGGIVELPAGRYRVEGNLVVPANVTLQGVYRVPPTPSGLRSTNISGSVLLAYAGRGSSEGKPFIRLAGNNAAIAGLTVAYPEWKQTDVPPVPYPPCVYAENAENVGVQDCCLLNPYEGIKFVRAARHLVRNVTGYPIKRGLFVDECYDIGHIENVHFWPFGVNYQPEDAYCKWINTNGVAFELARTDWHYVHNTFCFGYGVGYKFSKSKHGSTNGNFLGLGADSCQNAVVVEEAQPPGLLISNGEFVGRWGSTDSVCLVIGPEVHGKVSLVNCSFWGPIDRCVWMRAPEGQFTADACHFVDWDNAGTGSPAIQLEAGKAIVQGCTFNLSKLHVGVESNMVSAILTANQAEGGFWVENNAGKRTQSALNEGEEILNWPNGARDHYEVAIGRKGDRPYARGFHGGEGKPASFRWSSPVSRLSLPVTPGKAYTLTLEVSVPKWAVSEEAGAYVEGKKIAGLAEGNNWVIPLPPSAKDQLTVELRCQGWIPQRTMPGSGDGRTLGFKLFKLTMKSEGAPARLFNANSGEFAGQ